MSLGSFATAEEAALCVARSPEGQAAAKRAAASEEGQGRAPAMPSGAVLKQEGAVPPMPLGAFVKEVEVATPLPLGACFKEEGVVPPMPPDAIVKRERERSSRRRSARMSHRSGADASDAGRGTYTHDTMRKKSSFHFLTQVSFTSPQTSAAARAALPSGQGCLCHHSGTA